MQWQRILSFLLFCFFLFVFDSIICKTYWLVIWQLHGFRLWRKPSRPVGRASWFRAARNTTCHVLRNMKSAYCRLWFSIVGSFFFQKYLLQQVFITEFNYCNISIFQEIFASENICIRKYLHQKIFASRNICVRNICVKKYLHQEIFASKNIYVKKYLHQEIFASRNICVKK